ncbi:MAG: ABC transporter ATP-binding protein [Chitinophagales bacterium]|nr:ABC transporter ATP-binding protein [Chitinophagales bacterium]MDW8420022.1 ABC transporter ATP-binding protein [Chitinophagales bacterium]
MTDLAISTHALTKTYGRLVAVNNLNLQVAAGEVFGFLGPNGAGKSTTLRMLLTLISPTQGEIVVFGKNLWKYRNEILRQVGSIIEKPDFYLYLSAYDNLKIQAQMCGIHPTRKQLEAMFELVGLSGREHDKVKTYSHGMKQRLGLAQALIHNPKLIILDEPTTGLDPQGIIDLRSLILRMKNEKGITVLLSSHILSEIELIADSMAILSSGKVMVQGRVRDLLNPEDMVVAVEPCDTYTCLAALQNSMWSTRITSVTETAVMMRMSKGQLPELNRYLAENRVAMYGISFKRALEDYFLKLTASGNA